MIKSKESRERERERVGKDIEYTHFFKNLITVGIISLKWFLAN